MSILAVLEQREGEWHKMSFETLAAAQQFAKELNTTASAAVVGTAGELASKQLDKVYVLEHDLLKDYTPDGYAKALRQLIEKLKPSIVVFPHTYQVRDFCRNSQPHSTVWPSATWCRIASTTVNLSWSGNCFRAR